MTRRQGKPRFALLGYNTTGARAGLTPRPRFLISSCWVGRSGLDGPRGFASCRVALGGCPWASSAGRTSDCRRPCRSCLRHRPGRSRYDPVVARNHAAGAVAGGGLPRYRAAIRGHQLRARGTSRPPGPRAPQLRTERMRSRGGVRFPGPLECERQRPHRFLRRAHEAPRPSCRS